MNDSNTITDNHAFSCLHQFLSNNELGGLVDHSYCTFGLVGNIFKDVLFLSCSQLQHCHLFMMEFVVSMCGVGDTGVHTHPRAVACQCLIITGVTRPPISISWPHSNRTNRIIKSECSADFMLVGTWRTVRQVGNHVAETDFSCPETIRTQLGNLSTLRCHQAYVWLSVGGSNISINKLKQASDLRGFAPYQNQPEPTTSAVTDENIALRHECWVVAECGIDAVTQQILSRSSYKPRYHRGRNDDVLVLETQGVKLEEHVC
mmetsp:Transcript_11484/g.16409  ORF Transcript_11484/g.16409 Transcript_11484/m.16409 type:complete len:261 (-) Transcript_11484:299-1081(-)